MGRNKSARILANRLQTMLELVKEDQLYDSFQKFCNDYRYPLSRAFYKDSSNDFCTWFDLRLIFPSLGRGNFGEVFAAITPNGEIVAVKLLHQNILDDNNMLGGFRRGVRSLKILSDSGINGVVKIINSFELPPTIVMEHISGTTLEDVITSKTINDWRIKLIIVRKIAEIVHAGHALLQTVMHRDIKPSNIIVNDFEYYDVSDVEVTVLDFDMSWHKGSNEKDVAFESRDDFGYLAPEQTTLVKNVSAVSTRVDSYGLGMTAFLFLVGYIQDQTRVLAKSG